MTPVLILRRVVFIAAALAATGVATYFTARAIGHDRQIGDSGEAAVEATLKADSERPRFTGALAGIRLTAGGTDVGPEADCPEQFQSVPFASTKGTPLEIEPTYLPSGFGGESAAPSATACQGKLVGSGRSWAPSKPGGPWLWIQRVLRREAWTYSFAPAERVSSGVTSTATRSEVPVVFVKPVLPEGRGGSFVIFAEKLDGGFVVTVINGEAIPLDELKKVAEGLTR